MSTVVALKPSGRTARDPAVAAIEHYLEALRAWRASDRRIKRLKRKLPDELMRRPRVQVAWYLKGKDNAGADIREPIYAHNEWEIRERAKSDCKSMLSFHAPLYSWFVDPTAKKGLRKGVNKRAREQRPIIRAKYKAWAKDKLAAFFADRADLYERQRAAGWRQAVEAEEDAHNLAIRARYRLQNTKPTTAAGALALLKIVRTAYRSEANSSSKRAPYGLGEYYTARIAHHVAEFLKAPGANGTMKKAA